MNRKGIYKCGFIAPIDKREYEMYIPDPRKDKTYTENEHPSLVFAFVVSDGTPILTAWDGTDTTASRPAGTYTEAGFAEQGGRMFQREKGKTSLMSREDEFVPCSKSWKELTKGITEKERYDLDRRGFILG